MLAPYLQGLAAAIAAQGVRACTDPRDASPPVVLLLPNRIEPRTMDRARAVVRAVLIAPGPGNGDALAWLDDALPAVWAAAGRMLPAQLTAWDSPHTGTELLAYEVEITADLGTERNNV